MIFTHHQPKWVFVMYMSFTAEKAEISEVVLSCGQILVDLPSSQLSMGSEAYIRLIQTQCAALERVINEASANVE